MDTVDQLCINQSDDELAAKMAEAKRQGYRLEIHAIGDRAAASVLDGLEAAGVTPKDRAVITHCQLLGADLIERMAKLKCIANIQPQRTAIRGLSNNRSTMGVVAEVSKLAD